MGIFSFFSSKKEEKKPEIKVQPEPQFEGYRYPTVSASDWKELLEYADKNIPVYVLGGDCSGKKVVLVSKPSDTPTVKLLDDRIYSVVIVDRITIGVIEYKILLETATKEEEKEFIEDWKRRKATAEQEKAEFKKHEGEEGYEPHRFMRSIMSIPKPQTKPTPKQEVKQTQTSKPTLQSKPSQLSGKQKGQQKEKQPQQQIVYKPTVTNVHPTKEGQRNHKQTEQQKGQQSKAQSEQQKPEDHSVKEFHFNDQVPEADTLVFKLNKLISTLPEYDFYNGDHDKEVSEDLPSVKEIAKLKNTVDATMRQAYRAEQACDWRNAAKQYNSLVRLRCWDPKPYIRLIEVYKKSKVQSDIIHKLESLTINFFRKRSEKMKSDVLLLADKYDSRIYAEKCINEGKSITYYDGLFDLYNPYNEIEELLLNLT